MCNLLEKGINKVYYLSLGYYYSAGYLYCKKTYISFSDELDKLRSIFYRDFVYS